VDTGNFGNPLTGVLYADGKIKLSNVGNCNFPYIFIQTLD
jgi:hypothetical protein